MKVKVRYISTYNRPQRPGGGVDIYLYSFFKLGTRWSCVVKTTLRPLYTENDPVPIIGGWVGPRAGLDGAENLAHTGFDPRTVQSVASCINYSISAQNNEGK